MPSKAAALKVHGANATCMVSHGDLLLFAELHPVEFDEEF
jgi:hypothetical protein